MTPQQLDECKKAVWAYYDKHGRSMPWRATPTPYYVLVSEVMLQQTQVRRVEPKFTQFIATFPTVQTLAKAPLSDVLAAWSGLGYNRRAKFLWQAAQSIVSQHKGHIPMDHAKLVALPGIGPNTAAAIMAYADNQSTVFIETNIRTVLLHHFFSDDKAVSDAQLLPVVKALLDTSRPRQWYWALMDYGVYLKSQGLGRLSQSAHYKKQSTFKGSLRQMRGAIIKQLTVAPLTDAALRQAVIADDRYQLALQSLMTEGLIERSKKYLYLTGQAPPRDN